MKKHAFQLFGFQSRILFIIWVIYMTVFPFVVIAADVYDIPVDRRIVWAGNVGVEGGIPNRTIVRNCVALYGVRSDGTNTATEINNCLNSIANGEIAYLPAGTYVVTSTIKIPSHKTLRGAGQDSTTIRADADLQTIVFIGGGYTHTSGVGIISGYTKGSTQLVLASASAISAGNFIYVDELNDSSIPVDITGDGGSCTYCGRFGTNGTRARLQIVKVTGKSGNTINVSPPLFFSLSSTNSPQATKAPAYTQYAGVENLTVKNGSGTWNQTRKNIFMQGAANCWVKNVKVETCGQRCIDLWFDNFRNEIRDSHITGCNDQYNSDTCYGVHIFASSSNLIENNQFVGTASGGPILASASGNVIAYNYTYGVHRKYNLATWMWPDNWTHGSHNTMNLWEGNDSVAVNFDYIHGSGSHNTIFRNRFSGKDPTVKYDAYHQEMAAIIIEKNNHYINVIGNVLGTADFHSTYEVKNIPRGWTNDTIYATGIVGGAKVFDTLLRHMNYDFFNKAVKYCGDKGEPGCQGGSQSTALPASLYLQSKPSWWGNLPWPAIGPDVSPMAGTIPARLPQPPINVRLTKP
jgi:hypothetical protein